MIKLTATRLCSLALLASCAVLFSSCASDTLLKKTVIAPGVTSLQFKKVFIVALAADDINRRLVENTIKRFVTRVPAQVSHEIIPGVLGASDKAAVLKAIKDSGADGVIVLRSMGMFTEISTGADNSLPMEYQTFSGYYGTAYDVGAYYSQDRRQLNADRVVIIESNIYDAKTEKLMWSGFTQSTKDHVEYGNVGALATEIAKTLKEALAAQQLIPGK
jgi:hypothetical protein